jgi:hypothetical protein
VRPWSGSIEPFSWRPRVDRMKRLLLALLLVVPGVSMAATTCGDEWFGGCPNKQCVEAFKRLTSSPPAPTDEQINAFEKECTKGWVPCPPGSCACGECDDILYGNLIVLRWMLREPDVAFQMCTAFQPTYGDRQYKDCWDVLLAAQADLDNVARVGDVHVHSIQVYSADTRAGELRARDWHRKTGPITRESEIRLVLSIGESGVVGVLRRSQGLRATFTKTTQPTSRFKRTPGSASSRSVAGFRASYLVIDPAAAPLWESIHEMDALPNAGGECWTLRDEAFRLRCFVWGSTNDEFDPIQSAWSSPARTASLLADARSDAAAAAWQSMKRRIESGRATRLVHLGEDWSIVLDSDTAGAVVRTSDEKPLVAATARWASRHAAASLPATARQAAFVERLHEQADLAILGERANLCFLASSQPMTQVECIGASNETWLPFGQLGGTSPALRDALVAGKLDSSNPLQRLLETNYDQPRFGQAIWSGRSSIVIATPRATFDWRQGCSTEVEFFGSGWNTSGELILRERGGRGCAEQLAGNWFYSAWRTPSERFWPVKIRYAALAEERAAFVSSESGGQKIVLMTRDARKRMEGDVDRAIACVSSFPIFKGARGTTPDVLALIEGVVSTDWRAEGWKANPAGAIRLSNGTCTKK